MTPFKVTFLIFGLITLISFNKISCDFISDADKIISSEEILEKIPDYINSDEDSWINENYDENLNHINRHRHKSKSNRSWHQNYGHDNFLLTDYLVDGEMERRISFNGITAKETSLGNNSKSISLWQLSDGKAFVQVIFTSEHQLIDCEYVRQREIVRHFLSKFYREIDRAKSHNFTTLNTNNIPHHNKVHLSDHEFRQYIDNGVVTSEMDDIKNNYEDFGISTKFEDEVDAFGLRRLSYKKLESDSDIPEDIRQWMDVRSLRVMCYKRHRQMKKLAAAISGSNESERQDAEDHLNRQKRALADWFLAPNTKWCGKGNQAEKYNHLGGYSRADACCRKHDHCKFVIKGMTTKWNFFNYRPYSISHCSCDIRFRTCLKMADSSDANMVGRVFFNVLQTKCFVLKPEKICKERSWWGQCTKKGIRKRAHIRDNRKF